MRPPAFVLLEALLKNLCFFVCHIHIVRQNSPKNATLTCRTNIFSKGYTWDMKINASLQIDTTNLADGHIRLEYLTKQDTEAILAIYRDEFAAQSTLLRPALISLTEAQEWQQKLFETQALKIIDRANREVMGIIGAKDGALWDNDPKELFITIKTEHRRKGIATRAIRIFLAELFGQNPIEEIGAWVNLEFFEQLNPAYLHWQFRPNLTHTLALMMRENAPNLGYYILDREEFLKSFPAAEA